MSAGLCLLFLLSGAAALVFEALWFRSASLVFGSSVWASSLVLSSFMGGLALGNYLAGRFGGRVRRPLRAYALLELAVGVSGFALVVLLPGGSELLAPVFRPFLDRPLAQNTLRLGLAFLLLLVPCTSMGATLPLLVKAMRARERSFGAALGRLYGWNTAGGVAGALGVEVVLVTRFGLRGSALAAALLNLAAGAGALALERRLRAGDEAAPEAAPTPSPWTGAGRRLLALAFLCGATLLALEVVWFRFLQLFVIGTSYNFAVMLAVVLLGIALGALLAGRVLAREPRASRALPLVALAAAGSSTFAYLAMDVVEPLVAAASADVGALVVVAWVALPTCVLSGALFTLAGAALQREIGDDVRASAALTLANTVGGMVGAALGGFLLLPGLGMERSFFVLALAYVAIALLALDPPYARRLRLALGVAGAATAAFLALFPFGLMQNSYLKRLRRALDPDSTLVVVREGRLETIQYTRHDFLGEPASFRLITNRYSMSGSGDSAQRYMRLFVYWALAVRPEPERALLISYGVGNTAKALTEVRSLRSIDVVDISSDVLDLSPVPFPPPEVDPLRDPRVRVHVEDGRFFLQASAERFDLITAEPPPLKVAGVVNLYTQEYFELLRERLADRGVVTYWLPVYHLLPDETRALVRGFCGAFPDCTLWNGSAMEWMLAGSNGPPRPVEEDAFGRPWRDPATGPSLREIGVETPEQLGATFLADADQLREWTGEGPALVDDRPNLISHAMHADTGAYLRFMETPEAARRFAASRYIAAVWPPELRRRTQDEFGRQALLNAHLLSLYGSGPKPSIEALQQALTRPDLSTLAAWLLDSSPRRQRILERAVGRGDRDLPAAPLAARLVLRGEYVQALPLLEEARKAEPQGRWGQVLALCALLAGDRERARQVAGEELRRPDSAFARWVERAIGAGVPPRE